MKNMMVSFKLFLVAFVLPVIFASRRSHKAEFTSSRVTSSNSRMSSVMKCPSKCRCDPKKKEVNCSYKSLNSFPRNLPASTKRLILSGNKLKKIPRKVLAFLRNLEVLELNGNYLEILASRMFRNLKKLKKLNLSFNKFNSIPSRVFLGLKNLETLYLRGNNLGKLPLDIFVGLNKIKEIDLSANSLQTMELDTFDNLSSLDALFLDNNQWHCDCSLKETEEQLRGRGVKTGFLICDSPKLYAGRQLGGLSASSFCGTKAESLVYIVLGTISGIISILFLIFMCRRRIAPNLDLNETRNAITGKSKSRSLEDALSRSSLVYDLENDGSIPSRDKPVDLLRTSRDLKTDVLPLTDEVEANRRHSAQHQEPASVLLTFQPNVQSCPNLVKCSEKIDQFNGD